MKRKLIAGAACAAFLAGYVLIRAATSKAGIIPFQESGAMVEMIVMVCVLALCREVWRSLAYAPGKE